MFPLPDGWAPPELVSDVFVADGLRIHRAGLATTGKTGEEVCGSAADAGGPAVERAWYELLERITGLEADRQRAAVYEARTAEGGVLRHRPATAVFPESPCSERFRYSRSNGIALHVDYSRAAERARWELAERDRILRSWYGEIAPHRLDGPLGDLSRAQSYEWCAYHFPESDERGFARDVEVAAVFGFPKTDGIPFVLGFAGRPDLGEAVNAAGLEAVQLLAFLWGEPLPDPGVVGGTGAPSAFQHLDRYQVSGAHEIVRAWLDGAHARYATRVPARPSGAVTYVDLTPSWLGRGLRVVKAMCDSAVPLIFGESPFGEHLPAALRLHPIP